MVYNRNWYIIIGVFFMLMAITPFAEGLNGSNRDSLHSFLQDYAYKSLVKKPKTGTLYRVPLPSNFSGMEVSIVRLRSRGLWARGMNLSYVRIPPRVIPVPFVRRLAIVYENLGNWSSHYYKVPGHFLVSPVFGFMTYNATNLGQGGGYVKPLNLSFIGDPISIRFPHFLSHNKNATTATMKCAEFGVRGSVKLSDMTKQNMCLVKGGQGRYFAAVIPKSTAIKKRRRHRVWEWWVIGFGGVVCGMALVGVIGMVIFKVVKRKQFGGMERNSEEGVALDTIWIDRSKMPSARMIRTQPSLENECVP